MEQLDVGVLSKEATQLELRPLFSMNHLEESSFGIKLTLVDKIPRTTEKTARKMRRI